MGEASVPCRTCAKCGSLVPINETHACPMGTCVPVVWSCPKCGQVVANELAIHHKCAVAHDAVNHPSHYTSGGIECIDYLRAKLGLAEFVAYCRGNAIKYLSRAGMKGEAQEDLRKAAWYCTRAADEIAKEAQS